MRLGGCSYNLSLIGASTLTPSMIGFSSFGTHSRASGLSVPKPSSNCSSPSKPIALIQPFATPAALTKPMKLRSVKMQKSLWLGSKPTANKGN